MTGHLRIGLMASVGAAALLGAACNFDIEAGGETVTTTFDVEDFREVEIGNAFEAVIVVGDTTSVEVEIAEQLEDKLDVRVDGDRLHVGIDGGLISSSSNMMVTITTPELAALTANGATDIDVQNIDAADFDLQVNGASSVDAEGSVTNLTLTAEGASDVDLDGVSVDVADVTVGGASDVSLGDVSTVTGSVGGASSLGLPNSGTVDVEVSGNSSIDQQP